MMMTNQVVDTAKDAGGPPAMLLIDVEADADKIPEPPPVSVGESIALDGGSPPLWLLAEVSGQEDRGSIETLDSTESVELSSAEALPAGTAPDLNELGDDDAGTPGS